MPLFHENLRNPIYYLLHYSYYLIYISCALVSLPSPINKLIHITGTIVEVFRRQIPSFVLDELVLNPTAIDTGRGTPALRVSRSKLEVLVDTGTSLLDHFVHLQEVPEG